MRRPLDYDAPCGYTVVVPTDTLEEIERCECIDLFVIDGWYSCTRCGTVYGAVFGYSKVVTYNRKRWRA